MVLLRNASQGLCYQIRSIIHQLMVVNKAVADTAGFNQRCKSSSVVKAN